MHKSDQLRHSQTQSVVGNSYNDYLYILLAEIQIASLLFSIQKC